MGLFGGSLTVPPREAGELQYPLLEGTDRSIDERLADECTSYSVMAHWGPKHLSSCTPGMLRSAGMQSATKRKPSGLEVGCALVTRLSVTHAEIQATSIRTLYYSKRRCLRNQPFETQCWILAQFLSRN
eukprot:3050558-Prymnesium_polylepis.1